MKVLNALYFFTMTYVGHRAIVNFIRTVNY